MHTKQLFFSFICYSLACSLHAEEPSTKGNPSELNCPLENPQSFRLSAFHREGNGIGYDQGYTSVDTFFAFTSIRNWHPFFDIRAHFFNDGKVAANAGFGIRYEPFSFPVLFGVNGFFDFRRANHSTFEQVGAGIEVLGSKWEARANGYFPIINRTNLYDTSFIGFQNHEALFAVKTEFAFKGFDVSLGRTLLQKQYYTLSSVLGGYMFFASYGKSAKGGLFKLKTDISRYFSVEGQFSYDTLFKAIFQGQAGITVPFGKKVKARKKGLSCRKSFLLADRLTEAVDRFEIIVTDEIHDQTLAQNPFSKEPLYILFVDNAAPTGGNGTAESPYNTLAAAESHSSPGQMIYVYEGTGSAAGMSNGITLQDNQWLQGSGKSFLAATSFGLSVVPAQTTGFPTIRNSGGDAVTLSNNNIVQGINLVASGSAIAGSSIENLLASNNTCFSNSGYDFSLPSASGIVSLISNNSYGANGLSLSTGNNLILTLENNLFSNSGTENMDLSFSDSSVSTAFLIANTFQRSTNGCTISTSDTARLKASITQNTLNNIQNLLGSAFSLVVNDSSSQIAVIEDNTFTAPTIQGLTTTTTDSATSFFYVLNNTGTYNGSADTAYPFHFGVDTNASSTLALEDNTANSSGFFLSNASIASTFNVESPTFDQQGVEDQNSGSFTFVGPITFISPTFVPLIE